MRRHIWEQINYRLNVMDEQCFELGACKKCGCETPHLQMANKACEGKCYPSMMTKVEWKFYKAINKIDIKLYV